MQKMRFPTAKLLSVLCISFFLLFSKSSDGQGYLQTARFTESKSGISAMSTDKTRGLLVCGDKKGNLHFRKLNDGSFIKTISPHFNAVNTINFNSNGRLLISSTVDGEIKIFDFEKDIIIQGIYSPDYNGIRFVLFSIADGFIYFNSKNRLYKTRSDLSQKVNLIFEYEDSLRAAVITPDRNSLILATGNQLKVINTRSDILRQEISTGGSPVEFLTLLGDSLLAGWSSDGIIRFWPYQLGQLAIQPSHWFKAGVPSHMNFSKDGSLMVSGNIGTWARVWKPFSKVISQELFGHDGKITCSAFGESEKNLFTGSEDASVIMWNYEEKMVQEVLSPAPSQQKPPPTPAPVQAVKNPDSLKVIPEVIMKEENVPSVIHGRKVLGVETVQTDTPSIIIHVYDNSYLDGDTMSLFFNGEWLLDHYGVTKKKKSITLNFKANTNNYLVLFANNLGKSPPNTAAVEIDDGKSRRIFRLSSDLKSCSAINFIYKPKK